ncbi:MAG TPA: hypothetical protein VGK71_10165 [Nitrospirota bacterium]|jgi:hypothetical protein
MAEEMSVCTKCGAGSGERLLISCEKDGQKVWVCARCLPTFVHGQH